MTTQFKVAITIQSGDKPYLLQVAIPDGFGKFITHEYRFKRSYDALSMMSDYFHTFEKNPDSIMSFHKKTKESFEANLELPFA